MARRSSNDALSSREGDGRPIGSTVALIRRAHVESAVERQDVEVKVH